jgi:hypothetical protein
MSQDLNEIPELAVDEHLSEVYDDRTSLMHFYNPDGLCKIHNIASDYNKCRMPA